MFHGPIVPVREVLVDMRIEMNSWRPSLLGLGQQQPGRRDSAAEVEVCYPAGS